LIRAALLAGLLLFAGPALAEDWWQSVLGPYQGPVMNGGKLQQLDTEFFTDAAGNLVGRYHVEDEPPFDGELTDFRQEGPLAGSFTWHDRFGEGSVHVEFDPDRGRFTGSWGEDTPQPDLIFNGYRLRPSPGS